MAAEPAVGFRPLVAADRAMLEDWIARPHWAPWWGDPAQEAASIVQHIAGPDMGPFVITLDGRDAGYIQWWRPDGSWAIPVEAPPETSRGIDLSLAEATDCGRGVGVRALQLFVERLAADGIRRFLIDPAPDNAAARRACAKAGFAPVAEGVHSEGPYVLMVLDLPEPAEA